MSILLDALRKSEEQRLLGATPTLQTPEINVDLMIGEQRNWVPVAMMMVAAAAIAWIGFAQFHRRAPLPVAELVSAASPVQSLPTDSPLRADTTQEAANSLAKSPEIPLATTPVMDFIAEPQSTDPDDAPSETLQTGPGNRNVRSKPPRTIVSSGAGNTTRTEARAPATARATGEEPIAALVEDLSVSDVAARPDTDELQPYAAEPISYWQIPQSLREDMPEMRITVLVYAENPQDRFLLINGKRLREKEEVSDGVVVEEIQRDRAIFTFRDYRFQVKS